MNPVTESQMFREASTAPAVVEQQRAANNAAVTHIAATLRARPPSLVATCARGSSAHAATFARTLIEVHARVRSVEQSLSMISVYGVAPRAPSTFCLAISQSGMSPDIVAAATAFGRAGALTVAMVNDASSPLADAVSAVIPLQSGPEISVAATKSFIASLAASVDLVSAWMADNRLSDALAAAPAALDGAWQAGWPELVSALRSADGVFVLGRGYGLAVAREAALKLKETCGLRAEAFSTAEFRHGPMAMAAAGTPIVVFRQPDATASGVDALVADLRHIGATVLVAGASFPLPAAAIAPEITPMVQIQAFYRAAAELAVERGFDADRPAHLAKITETV
jgi:glucosamine--fructose-6-phosphate aminotransferase (isomerizing)